MSRVRDIANILSASTSIATDAEVDSLYAPLINPTFSRIGGDEGGQINFANAATNTTLSGNIALDIYQNRVRLFEGGGNNRGAYLDVSNLSNGVGSELIAAAPQSGNSGKYLTTNGTTASWGSISSGGMTVLASGSLSGSAVNLTSISGSYKDLQLIIRNYLPSADGYGFYLRFNSDSNANRYINGLSAGSAGQAFQSNYTNVGAYNDNVVANGLTVIDIFDYANTSTWKFYNAKSLVTDDTTTSTAGYYLSQGAYNQTGAITAVNLSTVIGTFGGTYILYGVS